MRKCIVLNTVDLTSGKHKILDNLFAEYLRVLNETLKSLPDAKSVNQLHRLTYSNIRETSFLPSDLVEEARKDVWAKRKTVKNGFKRCSIRLAQRWFRFVKTKRGNPCFRITYSPRKSVVIPIVLDRQTQRFNSFVRNGWNFKCISLIQNGKVAVVLEREFPTPHDENRFTMGVDIGSSTLAAVTIFDNITSKVVKQLYFGRDVAIKQRKCTKRRAELMSYADKGSEKARKYLARLRHKQANFVRTRSGQIAKEIVKIAKFYNASVAVEKLSIRGRKRRFNRKSNRKINRIPFAKFVAFLESGCKQLSLPLSKVDAYHTSKWCPHCGAVNPGHLSGNHALYKCKECGMVVNSDRKASLAIAVKSVLERNIQGHTKPCFVQISSTRVPVNGLVRPDAVGSSCVVHDIGQSMESRLF